MRRLVDAVKALLEKREYIDVTDVAQPKDFAGELLVLRRRLEFAYDGRGDQTRRSIVKRVREMFTENKASRLIAKFDDGSTMVIRTLANEQECSESDVLGAALRAYACMSAEARRNVTDADRRTYGDILVDTVGEIDRAAKRTLPVDGTSTSIGGRLGELQKTADGRRA